MFDTVQHEKVEVVRTKTQSIFITAHDGAVAYAAVRHGVICQPYTLALFVDESDAKKYVAGSDAEVIRVVWDSHFAAWIESSPRVVEIKS